MQSRLGQKHLCIVRWQLTYLPSTNLLAWYAEALLQETGVLAHFFHLGRKLSRCHRHETTPESRLRGALVCSCYYRTITMRMSMAMTAGSRQPSGVGGFFALNIFAGVE